MELSDMTKDERSLLLFLESCAVEYGGLVDVRHMNTEDREIAEHWNQTGFLRFGRVKFHDIKHKTGGSIQSHWCELSDEAWQLAWSERRARYVRMNNKRSWERTEERHMELVDHA